MKKILLVAFLLLMLNQLQPTAEVHALSCVERPTMEKAYEQYDGIIVGQVDQVITKETNNQTYNEIQVTVLHSFKGVEIDSLTFSENITWGSLNGPSQVGTYHLFFLNEQDGTWENPLCSPSEPLDDPTKWPEFFEGKEIPLKQAAVPLDVTNEPTEADEQPEGSTTTTGSGITVKSEADADLRLANDEVAVERSNSLIWIASVIGLLIVLTIILRSRTQRKK